MSPISTVFSHEQTTILSSLLLLVPLISFFLLFCFVFFLESGSHVQPRVASNSRCMCHSLPSPGITGICPHTWQFIEKKSILLYPCIFSKGCCILVCGCLAEHVHLFVVYTATYDVTMPFLNCLLSCSHTVRLVSGFCSYEEAAIHSLARDTIKYEQAILPEL